MRDTNSALKKSFSLSEKRKANHEANSTTKVSKIERDDDVEVMTIDLKTRTIQQYSYVWNMTKCARMIFFLKLCKKYGYKSIHLSSANTTALTELAEKLLRLKDKYINSSKSVILSYDLGMGVFCRLDSE